MTGSPWFEWLPIIATILQVIIIPTIAFLYKHIDNRFSKIESKVENISVKTIDDIVDKINRITDGIININNKLVEFNLTKDNVKALETYIDKLGCPGIDECSKSFQRKEDSITKEILDLTIDMKLAQFELKSIKEGRSDLKGEK